MRYAGLVVAVGLLAACGGASPGGACNKNGFLCFDTTTALECRDGKWLALPCRGSGGCVAAKDGQSHDIIKCDMIGNKEGDACASTAENRGLCTPDGKAVLECRQGNLAQTATCSSCAVANDQVVCQP